MVNNSSSVIWEMRLQVKGERHLSLPKLQKHRSILQSLAGYTSGVCVVCVCVSILGFVPFIKDHLYLELRYAKFKLIMFLRVWSLKQTN